VLTESLGRPELYRRRDHGEDGGAAETERGVREVLGSSGALDCTGRRAMPLRSKTWGSNRDNPHRRRVIEAAGRAHLRRVPAKLRRGRGSDRGKRAQGDAWARGGALERLGRSGGAAGRRGRDGEEEWRGAELVEAAARVRDGGAWVDGVQGGRRMV